MSQGTNASETHALDPSCRYEVSADVLVQHVGAKTLLVHLRSNRILELSPTASAAWTLMQEGLTENAILGRLTAIYAAAPGVIAAELRQTLHRFVEEGLIRARTG
jgi:hypothetical protein